MSFEVVACTTMRGRALGYNQRLPWPSIPSDMAHFKALTEGSAVIMGRKTWESLPVRPLPLRVNIVVTRQKEPIEDVRVAANFEEALLIASSRSGDGRIFVIGGARLYAEALAHPDCKTIHLTEILREYPCDVQFPVINDEVFELSDLTKVGIENEVPFQFATYTRKAALHQELQYLNLVREVLECGQERQDRTGVGTLSLFGKQMRFDLRKEFPLLTTKRVFWRGVVEELLWFVRGSTDSELLHSKGVNIWDGNGSRDFLDSIGKQERAVGDLGPVYGFQWRHFGAKYIDKDMDYSHQGFDQLAWVIHMIKNAPTSRRIVMSAWNPLDVPDMALPPCHVMCQFYVGPNQELSCQMYQRSCDLGLGVPFNIASYALLTCMIAHVCGLKPGWFIHSLGDTHVYLNHIEALREQLEREPLPFPRLKINEAVRDIDKFTRQDFELTGYDPHPALKMPMAC